MTYFLRQPEGIFLRDEAQLLSVDKVLPIATYTVMVIPGGEYYLKEIDGFTRPPKTYGNVGARADRIMNTFLDRAATTGVLLSGEQGSGKTMLARELSLLAAEMNIATIIVSSPFCGPGFNMFIQSIDIPAVVIIDEFEKLYDEDDQEKMLTLLDGVYPSKKLFVLTCNNVHRVDEHMLNRPGRVYYHLKYEGLEEEFIAEYCYDLLKDKAQTPGVCSIAKHFYAFNFDMLKALVEEMNRYNLSATEAVEMLNMSPTTIRSFEHAMDLEIDGKKIELHNDDYHGNPLSGSPITLTVYASGDDDEDDSSPKLKSPAIVSYSAGRYNFKFEIDDLKGIDKNVFTFVKGNATLRLTREVDKKFVFHAF